MNEHKPTPRTYTPSGRAAYKKKKRRQAIIMRTVILLLLLLIILAIGYFVFSKLTQPKTGIAQVESTISAVSPSQTNAATVSTQISEESILSSETAPAIDKSDWRLLLVNQSHPLPESFTPTLGEIPAKYLVNPKAYQFDSRALEDLLAMIAAAEKEGQKLRVTSAYRDPEYQKGLFTAKVNEIMTEEGLDKEAAEKKASEYVAIPGTSEHGTGLAADIVSADYFQKNDDLYENFEDTPEFAWLDAHAAEYGFILRFPKGKEPITKISYEPWHYRYVGKENAQKIKASGLTLEEYLGQSA